MKKAPRKRLALAVSSLLALGAPSALSAAGPTPCPLAKSNGTPFFTLRYKGNGHYELWCSGRMVDEVFYDDRTRWAGAKSDPDFNESRSVGNDTNYYFTDGWAGLTTANVWIIDIEKPQK